MKQFTASAITAACLAILPTASFAAAATEPDATIELKEGSVAAGIGFTWGKGTLHYQGRSIPVTVKGLSVASIGAGSITASGDVYHLANLSDFDGNYTAVSAGAALAGGGSVAAMENSNGVVI